MARYPDIEAMLEELRANAGDPEADHLREDRLRRLVLEKITRCRYLENAKELARLALSTDEIVSERWYA
jgi:hypothetical protein